MNLTIDDILKNSYVISIDTNRFCRFKEIFLKNGITNIPSLYKGFKLKLGTYYGCTLKQPSILCCLTHLSIIKLAQINNLPFVCIFEDDAFPIKNIISEKKIISIDKTKTYITDTLEEENEEKKSMSIAEIWAGITILLILYDSYFYAVLRTNKK